MEWHKSELSQDNVKALAEKYGCDLLCASILLRRGITAGEEIRYYLENDLRHLRNPFDIPGMEDAVERILAAKEEGEKIMVFGDRDVDGITGTALLAGFLGRHGFDVQWRLPMGEESYGLSVKAIEDFAANYGTLIITVDCGISNREEIARAAELGVGVVVTDHHNPPELLPNADALVNPKLPGRYPFRHLCGCAVAYKLSQALRFAMKSEVYGQSICLLNTRPSNDSVIIETAKLRNLCVIDTLSETVVPGMVSITGTRLPAFLSSQQILCWDLPLQQKLLTQAFGKGIEVVMLDIAVEIGKAIPQTAGKSLFRLKEMSKIGKYSDQAGASTNKAASELDVLVNLFTSFVQKKEGYFNEEDEEELQLAALGTIADIMPLQDENRLIVRKGLKMLLQKPRAGISDILLTQNLAGRQLSAEEVSWQLTPVINAAGRMGHAEKAVSLLLAETAQERNVLAAEITEMNNERKRLVDEVFRRAKPEAYNSLSAYSGNLAIYADENILTGITGLVANRLAEHFNVPALTASFTGNFIKGSIRSVREYDLSFMLDQCRGLFLAYGGHDFAAGFSMEKSNWNTLLVRLKSIAANMELAETKKEKLEIDAEIPFSYFSLLENDPKNTEKKELYLCKLADSFEPYGEKNRPLLFLSKGLKIEDITLMGKDELKHVKLMLDTGKIKWPAVYWNAASRIKTEFDKGDIVDVVYTVNKKWFNGTVTPQLIIKDLKVQK